MRFQHEYRRVLAIAQGLCWRDPPRTLNYRVDNLPVLVDQLRKDGVTITDTIETYNYGKFVHILDAEGNKIELWEPNDAEYEKMGTQMGAETTK